MQQIIIIPCLKSSHANPWFTREVYIMRSIIRTHRVANWSETGASKQLIRMNSLTWVHFAVFPGSPQDTFDKVFPRDFRLLLCERRASVKAVHKIRLRIRADLHPRAICEQSGQVGRIQLIASRAVCFDETCGVLVHISGTRLNPDAYLYSFCPKDDVCLRKWCCRR